MKRLVGRLAAVTCVLYVLYLAGAVAVGARPFGELKAAGIVAALFTMMTWATMRARRRRS